MRKVYLFQFLIGKVQQNIKNGLKKAVTLFQFLIGKVQQNIETGTLVALDTSFNSS